MSFYRSLSYFVNACFLNSARRHVKCFHLHLKIWLFLQLTCLSEVPRTTVPRIYPHISRKLLDSCFISQNFAGFFFKPSFTSKLYQQMCLGGVKAWGILSLLRAFCCVACRVETLSRKLQWAAGVINLVDWLQSLFFISDLGDRTDGVYEVCSRQQAGKNASILKNSTGFQNRSDNREKIYQVKQNFLLLQKILCFSNSRQLNRYQFAEGICEV